jgi:putative methylase
VIELDKRINHGINMRIRKKDMEILLQKLPQNPSPNAHLEQYQTPANIAADILFTAYQEENITDKTILDQGCGTGVFSIGAKLLGAQRVIGIDIDSNELAIGIGYADQLNIEIEFIEQDISLYDLKEVCGERVDTVIQNPPFGAQKSARGIDRIFLKSAIERGKIIYSLHLSKTCEFIELLTKKLGGEVCWTKEYEFPIKHQFMFHNKEIKKYLVTLFKINSKTK